MKSNLIIFFLMNAAFVPNLYAATKSISCTVSTMQATQNPKPINMTETYSITVEPIQGYEVGSTSQTIKLPDGMEIVLDLFWASGSLANDDITSLPIPRLNLSSRLQKRDRSGKTVILDIEDSMHPQIDNRLSMIFANNSLKIIPLYSQTLEGLKNSGASNDALTRDAFATRSGILIYSVSCSTRL